MIFRDGLHRKVLSGQKVQHRIPVKRGEEDCRFRRDNDYSIQIKVSDKSRPFGRRLDVVGRFQVRAEPVRARLGDMTLEDAKREGFKSLEDFAAHWEEHVGAWRPGKEVWVLSVTAFTDIVRIPAADSTQGYTTRSEFGLGRTSHRVDRFSHDRREPEPESVDEESEAKITADAQARFNADHVDEAVDMGAKVVANRIAKVQREGMRYGLDLGPKLQALIREHQQEINQLRKAA